MNNLIGKNMAMKVSANIVDELSDKIPSYLVAINELIKNSYDARANNVSITIDSKKKVFIIEDDGIGMNETTIDSLLHISKSNKDYAKLQDNNRHTQGSKGLGFLAVFKFGHYTTWITKHNSYDTTIEFSVDYDKLIKLENINDYNISFLQSKENLNRGTKIIIYLKEKDINTFMKQFNDDRILKRILYSFTDDDFNININIDNTHYSNKKKINHNDILPERVLFNVKYNSSKSKIEYYHNHCLAFDRDFKINLIDTKIELDLNYYRLYSGAISNIDNLYHDPQGQIAPLIYINDNLFENYDLFNPLTLQYTKYDQIVRQFLGIIKINSENKELDFNSDRTQMISNPYTYQLNEFLKSLNNQIQKDISSKRNHLVPRYKNDKLSILKKTNTTVDNGNVPNIDILKKNILDDFAFKDKVNILYDKNNKKVIYRIFNKDFILKYDYNDNKQKKKIQNNTPNNDSIKGNYKKAHIKLMKSEEELTIPTDQIDLLKYIDTVIDSNGNSIDKDNIDIYIDNKKSSNVLESITSPKTMKVEFRYNDKITGLVAKQIIIYFKEARSKIVGNNKKTGLISLPTDINYVITFNNVLNKLINQINRLNEIDNLELISCALRSIFEISCDTINKYDNKFFLKNNNKTIEKNLEKRVYIVMDKVNKNNQLKSKISNNTKIDYDSLNSMLSNAPEKYEIAVKHAHLGAHKSTTYLTESEIKDLAKYASLFLVISNEIVNFKK